MVLFDVCLPNPVLSSDWERGPLAHQGLWHTVGAPQQCELKSILFSADSSWETLLGTTQALYGFEISQRFSSLRRDKLLPHGVIPRTLRWDLAFFHVTAH